MRDEQTNGTDKLTRFLGIPSGSITFAALCLSVTSGLFIAFRYDPSQPFESTSALIGVLPFGSFFRGLHYYSSHLFLIMMLVHLIRAVVRERYIHWPRTSWFSLIFLALSSYVVNLTGFLLRGDADSAAAETILRRLIMTLPVGTDVVSALFFMPADHPLVTMYLQHILILTAVVLVVTWNHIGHFRALFRSLTGVISGCTIITLLLPAPLGPPPETYAAIRMSPWYFAGFQELLRVTPVWFAGFGVPGMLFGLLCVLPLTRSKRHQQIVRVLLGIAIIVYCLLTILAYIRYFVVE